MVANKKMAESVEIGRYYMAARSIPDRNFLILSLTTSELISREDYDHFLKNKVLDKINQLKSEHTTRIAAIVLIRGIPLKVAPPLIDPVSTDEGGVPGDSKKNRNRKINTFSALEEKVKHIGNEVTQRLNMNMRAAVDSELALVKAGNYPLDGWVENPYFPGSKKNENALSKDQALLVCRLDALSSTTVYRMIDDSVQIEKEGIKGKAYFDARWPENNKKERSGYTIYDKSLHGAAKIVSKRMSVVLDDQEDLFAEKSCPDAALYCGWYSLASYIDSFDWKKGAIGYHIASAECSTLRDDTRPLWCSKMLEHGVAATIGPVYEPYVQGFPLPELFFGYLAEGYFSLGEAYLISLPYLSWQTVLIGDPLYKPFKPIEEKQEK